MRINGDEFISVCFMKYKSVWGRSNVIPGTPISELCVIRILTVQME